MTETAAGSPASGFFEPAVVQFIQSHVEVVTAAQNRIFDAMAPVFEAMAVARELAERAQRIVDSAQQIVGSAQKIVGGAALSMVRAMHELDLYHRLRIAVRRVTKPPPVIYLVHARLERLFVRFRSGDRAEADNPPMSRAIESRRSRAPGLLRKSLLQQQAFRELAAV